MPQPGLLPDVMSLSAAAPFEYRSGLRKPSGAWPALRRASLRSATTLANVGLDALVPVSANGPCASILKKSARAEMSGNARPDALYRPAFSVPCAASQAETAASWYAGRG